MDFSTTWNWRNKLFKYCLISNNEYRKKYKTKFTKEAKEMLVILKPEIDCTYGQRKYWIANRGFLTHKFKYIVKLMKVWSCFPIYGKLRIITIQTWESNSTISRITRIITRIITRNSRITKNSRIISFHISWIYCKQYWQNHYKKRNTIKTVQCTKHYINFILFKCHKFINNSTDFHFFILPWEGSW